jgi:hypothetical protein
MYLGHIQIIQASLTQSLIFKSRFIDQRSETVGSNFIYQVTYNSLNSNAEG